MRHHIPVLLLLAVLTTALITACSKTQPVPSASKQVMPDCQSVYVYAPGNFIIDIAGGSTVVLDPAVHDFPLFCTPGEARTALDNEIALGRLQGGDWRIYLVEGTFQDLAYPLEEGGYGLKRMAPIVDWVTENI